MNKKNIKRVTLLEMLVVIAIIALLAGFSFPVVSKMREKARRAEAQADVANLVLALQQYENTYGSFKKLIPLMVCNSGNPTTGFLDYTHYEDFIDTLTAENTAYNPKGIKFLPQKTSKQFVNPNNTANKMKWSDPWGANGDGARNNNEGRPYRIVFDINYDNKIAINSDRFDDSTSPITDYVSKSFVVFTHGPIDNIASHTIFDDNSTTSDDKTCVEKMGVVSWE